MTFPCPPTHVSMACRNSSFSCNIRTCSSALTDCASNASVASNNNAAGVVEPILNVDSVGSGTR